jgi:hypothetical protein
MKLILNILLIFSLLSCHRESGKNTKPVLPTTANQKTGKNPKPDPSPMRQQQMEFIEYNDDGDYFLVTAKKADSLFTFINQSDDRSLSRGDVINLEWEPTFIESAGDGGRQVKAEKIISMVKVTEGNVSRFRRYYQKKLTYTWSVDENYSQSYLDKLYLLVEYYIANSKNELLRLSIKNRDQLTFSIEEQRRSNKDLILIGISATSEHHLNAIQWLYIEKANNVLYEYELSDDIMVRLGR